MSSLYERSLDVEDVEDVFTSELMSKTLVERAFSMVLGAPAFEALGAERAEVSSRLGVG